MNLQIRDPRARELAKRIAQRRHISMTDAVVEALEAEYRRVCAQQSLAERLSYACAKAQSIPLLYKGKDFSHTDLG